MQMIKNYNRVLNSEVTCNFSNNHSGEEGNEVDKGRIRELKSTGHGNWEKQTNFKTTGKVKG
jgi:hypothetical protein